MGRSMMTASKLPKEFWAEGVATAVYLLNISPTKAVMNRTPYEAWKGRKPRVSHLRIFGCIAYALVTSPSRSKLDEKSQKCIFVGYSSQSKAYRLYNPMSGKVIISRDVKFNEQETWIWNSPEPGVIEIPDNTAGPPEPNPPSPSNNTPSNSIPPSSSNNNIPPSSPNNNGSKSSNSNTSSFAYDHTPKKFRSLADIYASCRFSLLASDPMYFDEAVESEEWKEAMNEEILVIRKNNTWELVDLPEGKNVTKLKWVYHTKYRADGTIQKHKARLVAKGYAQEEGVDFGETFSPVARFETVRTFLALAAQLQWPVYQLDVKSAFLNGELEEEVYVAQPEGYAVNGCEDKVYKLKKALYGLKQAPRAWYSKIDSYFLENGFERSKNEPTLYVKKRGTDFLVLCLYVDDMIYMGSCESIVAEFKSSVMEKFEISDLGLLHYFLGLKVNQCVDGIFISQHKYAVDLLKRFNMLDCNPTSTPMNVNESLRANDGTDLASARFFRRIVGGLNYLSHTRPDIAFSVSAISRFMHNPTVHHLGAAKRIICYVMGTIDHGIWYSKVSNPRLVGYTDSDWAGSLDDRKSTSGHVFSLGSGAISWSSKKQGIVALSSSEAEYVAATASACQAVWLRRLLADFGQVQEGATQIYCDNKVMIAMSKNPTFHSRTKHIDIRYHFLRDLIAKGIIELKHCGTRQQVADVLTKSLPNVKHDSFKVKMGVT
ncbi:hypothetical protein OSB04_029154 [Centaurea solstitialis]|uniref:Reverse transcriptase Ty1/copia-type domain-containing protein n=1 Tax=Centaurea solstitialis TaxID=347529 RepID=A0AA38T1V8_9ASTR|nr:hypothetical protein OSB04_029154 [Centaurea solstitialis]